MKIQHRKVFSPSGAIHRPANGPGARVTHRPASALSSGQHRKIEDVAITPGFEPPIVSHRPGAASSAKIEHIEAPPPNERAQVAHRLVSFPVAEELPSSFDEPTAEPTSEEEDPDA